MGVAASKRAGATVESALLQRHPELRHVPDDVAEHHDAVAVSLLSPSRDLPFVGLCLLETGTVVEIKSAMVVYGERQRRGRFLIREAQHNHLLEKGGVYLFAVCAPTPDRDIIAAKVIPASLVDEFNFSWVSPKTRSNYAQFAWSRVFSPEEVEG
ncbi:hypothetical protein C440_12684 [Haloferax mucosum ATCC BAA-1512]|uniref:PD(D/E)XK endonuclease domain-containing protein n=1 Tax=Haloferax mucosum ATCC BAA-1512 TaxID=662479 RepID=M0I858_9EURY|nr:hypothetical protein [Haloferax mucosum]ELZ92976.1 hypothetical protein C440_12684 [Haloferax mucosum ATCC BAA-1512]